MKISPVDSRLSFQFERNSFFKCMHFFLNVSLRGQVKGLRPLPLFISMKRGPSTEENLVQVSLVLLSGVEINGVVFFVFFSNAQCMH